MAQAKLSGFILDTPRALIKNSKGIASFVTSTSGSVTFNGESIEISGGWSNYALAEIDTKKSIEIELTDAQWDLDQMALATGGTRSVITSDYEIYGDPKVIDSGTYKITLPVAVIPGSIRINGFTETVSATPAPNQFKVTISATTEILFPATEAGKTVYPAYKVSLANAETLTAKTTDFPKAGEVTLTFPIFQGENQTDADILGYGQFVIWKCKILQDNTYGGSYKSASTFTIRLKGLDPRRSDGSMYRFTFIPKESYVG